MQPMFLWRNKQQVIQDLPCTCVDGRTSGARYSVAGGSFGLVIWILSKWESESGNSLDLATVEEALELFASEVSPLYLHSDQHAIELIYSKMGLSPQSTLQQLTGAQKQMFSCLASKVDYQGCGHLKLTMEDPKGYQVSPGLLAKAFEAFFKLYFGAKERVLFDILQGEHSEKQIVLLNSENQASNQASNQCSRQASPYLEKCADLDLTEQVGQDKVGIELEKVSKVNSDSVDLVNDDSDQVALLEDSNGDSFFCHRPLKVELIAKYLGSLETRFSEFKGLPNANLLAEEHNQIAAMTLDALAANLPIKLIQSIQSNQLKQELHL